METYWPITYFYCPYWCHGISWIDTIHHPIIHGTAMDSQRLWHGIWQRHRTLGIDLASFAEKKITQQEQGHISVADQSCFKKHEEYIMYVCILYIYVYTYIIYYIYMYVYMYIYMNIIQLDLGVTILPSDPLHKPGTWGAAIEPLPCPARCPWLLQASRASNGEAMFIHGRNVSQQSPNRRSSRKDLLKWISQQDQAASYNI